MSKIIKRVTFGDPLLFVEGNQGNKQRNIITIQKPMGQVAGLWTSIPSIIPSTSTIPSIRQLSPSPLVSNKTTQVVNHDFAEGAKHDFAEYLHIWESMLFLVIIAAALYLQYTSYIVDKKKNKINLWFFIELGVYGLSAWATFGWIRWMRNAVYNPRDYWVHTFQFVILITAFTVCLEIGTVNNIFVETIDTESVSNETDIDVRQKKEESLMYQKTLGNNLLESCGLVLWSLPVIILLLRFIKGWGVSHYIPETMIPTWKTPLLYVFFLSFLGTLGMILLLVFRSRTDTVRHLFFKISGYVFCFFLVAVFLYLLYQSIRLKKDQIKSYFLGRAVSPWKILVTFLFEIIIASLLMSLPVILTAYFRNIQFGVYHLLQDHAFWKEFGFYGGKMLVILILSQIFGVFNNFNDGILQLPSAPGTVLYSRVDTTSL